MSEKNKISINKEYTDKNKVKKGKNISNVIKANKNKPKVENKIEEIQKKKKIHDALHSSAGDKVTVGLSNDESTLGGPDIQSVNFPDQI